LGGLLVLTPKKALFCAEKVCFWRRMTSEKGFPPKRRAEFPQKAIHFLAGCFHYEETGEITGKPGEDFLGVSRRTGGRDGGKVSQRRAGWPMPIRSVQPIAMDECQCTHRDG
jgi:hypothetical protein